MVSENICLEVLRLMLGKSVTMTLTFFPGDENETVSTSNVDNAITESALYRPLLANYDLSNIEAAVRWLQLGEFVGRTQKGLRGPWAFTLTQKGVKAAEDGKFSDADRHLLYRAEPYQVFVAHQFNDDDQELVRYLRDEILLPAGYSAVDGRAEGLEEFRQAILSKMSRARFFLCLLTKRSELVAGTFVSSVWLYQEIGAAMALDKKPLLLVEEGIDPHFTGELQKTYEYFEFTRSNHTRVFKKIVGRFNADLEADLIPLPK